MTEFLTDLNERQREGVENIDGPTLIIAGAGSGKTRVLTYRIAYLLASGVKPYQILALTFTNKAAKEMRERVEQLVGDQAKDLWMGTFHSVFAKILRVEATHIGFDSNFTIYDTQDSQSVVKSIIKERRLDDEVYKPKSIYNRISGCKNNLISAHEYNNNPIYFEEDKKAQRPEVGKIYKLYVNRCQQANAMDFDDLLYRTNVLFRDKPEVLKKYQERFRYVLIDEFQDTNLSQYLIVRRLSAKHKNVCVVGDDAQSIYAFRGADIRNILNFEKDYPGLRIIKLEQNYRSTQNILNAANHIIGHNKKQIKKKVWTQNAEGELIDLFKATNDSEEARLVVSSIFERKVNESARNTDFVILYRTNAQSRSFEEALRKQNINYQVVGGLSFYQRKEIKDLLAYLRFTINPKDEEALRRIINYPKRGIGLTSFNKIIDAARSGAHGIWDVLKNVRSFLPGLRSAAPTEDFVRMVHGFQKKVEKENAFEAARFIAKSSGLLRELFDDQTVEGRTRYENIQELLNGIQEFVDNDENEDKSLAAFLQEVALITTIDESEDKSDTVTLMTIHGAKGLEFPYVYIVGLEEDLFPSSRMIGNKEDLEEERRLFYVAITRAKKKLSLSYALQRYRFGTLKPCEPSRFLFELDQSLIRMTRSKSNFAKSRYGEESAVSSGFSSNLRGSLRRGSATSLSRKPSQAEGAQNNPYKDFKPSNPSLIQSGSRVVHLKFGKGTVLNVDEHLSSKRATIDFEKAGTKTLVLAFAKLMLIKD